MEKSYKIRAYKGMAVDILKYLPLSIINVSRNEKLFSAIADENRPVIANAEKSEKADASHNYEYAELTFTEFSPDLTEFIYTFFLHDYPDASIFDPFSGRKTRGMMAYMLGYNYFGIDLDQRNIDDDNKQLLIQRRGKAMFDHDFEDLQDIRFVQGDSTDPQWLNILQPESFDFALTCPPYYDLEVYSNDPRDLSNKQTYEEFLNCIARSWETTYKLLKHDTFFVFVANFFRHDGRFHHLAKDLVTIGEQKGFKWYDEVIIQLRSARAIRTMSGAFQRYHTAKSHEYMEVLYKP